MKRTAAIVSSKSLCFKESDITSQADVVRKYCIKFESIFTPSCRSLNSVISFVLEFDFLKSKTVFRVFKDTKNINDCTIVSMSFST